VRGISICCFCETQIGGAAARVALLFLRFFVMQGVQLFKQNVAAHLIVKSLSILLLWLAPSAVFLMLYVFVFDRSVLGSAAHLLLVFCVAATLFFLLLTIARFIGSRRATVGLGVSVTWLWLTFTITIYALILIGLTSWGRVPTTTLMSTYVSQSSSLMSVLGLSPVLVTIGALILGALVLSLSFHLTKNAWLHLCSRDMSKSGSRHNRLFFLYPILLATAACGVTAQIWGDLVFFVNQPVSDEPLYLAVEASPVGQKKIQSIVFERIGDQRRKVKEKQIEHEYIVATNFEKRNVVLITVDALRPDRMQVYGHERVTTPYLAELLAQGNLTKVVEARSACAESSCGLLSLLSGKQPHELLARNFGLMEVLAKHGYKRHLFLSGDHTNFYGLKELYGSVDTYHDGVGGWGSYANDDLQLVQRLRQFPAAQSGDSHFFMIHLMSVHGLGLRHQEYVRWEPARSIYHPSTRLDEESVSLARNFYDNGVLQADSVIRAVYSTLEQKGYIDRNSLVLVTSDHAEGLGDHGVKAHAESVYDSVLRIPWMWLGRPPRMGRSDAIVQADYAPTVLVELGIPVPIHWSGKPLQSPLSDVSRTSPRSGSSSLRGRQKT
jgi:glucan phosphoethanolaminetransferase (alkaline phosphatase superfamily)